MGVVAAAGLFTVPARFLAVWVIVVVILRVAVCFAVVVVAIALMERNVVGFLEDGRW
jgi:hypothetical protein